MASAASLLCGACAVQDAGPPSAPAGAPGALGRDLAAAYDFGDNSSLYAYEGFCSDPRFTGDGMATELDPEPGRDAADCAILYDSRAIALADGQGLPRRN